MVREKEEKTFYFSSSICRPYKEGSDLPRVLKTSNLKSRKKEFRRDTLGTTRDTCVLQTRHSGKTEKTFLDPPSEDPSSNKGKPDKEVVHSPFHSHFQNKESPTLEYKG